MDDDGARVRESSCQIKTNQSVRAFYTMYCNEGGGVNTSKAADASRIRVKERKNIKKRPFTSFLCINMQL